MPLTREAALRALALANAAKKRIDAERREARKGGELPQKHLRMLLLSLGGADWDEIALQLHIKTRKHVGRVLRSPAVVAERDKIVNTQRERTIAGEFGVQAMAKAHAEAAAKVLIGQALGNTTIPIAHADQRRAAVDVLKLSGDMQEKKVTEHVHRLIKDFTTEELQTWLSGRGMPKRIADQLRVLGIEYHPNGGA